MKNLKWDFDPYRILFPAGAIAAFAGLGLWLLFQMEQLSFYPRQAHANIMYFGFLWAFVAGFLMTAIPKMTGSQSAKPWEMILALALIAVQIALNIFNFFEVSIFCFFFQTLFLISFVLQRWLKTRKVPFEGFVFLPMAFLQALLGFGLFIFSSRFSMDQFYLLTGEAFILNLVLGLGTRLIPVLSRVPNALSPHMMTARMNFIPFILMAVALNAGFWIQMYFNDHQIGILLRLVVVAWMAYRYFRIFSKVLIKSYTGFGLRSGVFFILSSYVISVINSTPSIAVQHLLYVGGFVLITFMVGTRVMLAHGGQSLDYEIRSLRIGTVALLLGLASLFRLIAASNIFGIFMSLGIVVFFVGLALWTHKFVVILKEKK